MRRGDDDGFIGIAALDLNATLPSDTSTDLGSSISVPSQDDHVLKVAPESMDGMAVVDGERLWHLLPEEIVYLIVMRLPLASQGRLRCVCRTWARFISLLPYWTHATPPCMIITSSGVGKKKFFCASEAKWCTLPFRSHSSMSSEGNWEVLDTSSGLLLHQCSVEGRLRLCVCNPLTSSSRDISPKHPDGSGNFLGDFSKAKLLVDLVSKTFKVVFVTCFRDWPPLNWTMIYDSTKCHWLAYQVDRDRGGMAGGEDYFVWKNVLFGYEVHSTSEHYVVMLDMESGQWNRVNSQFPRDPAHNNVYRTRNGMMRPYSRNHFILSDNKQVRLFQFISRRNHQLFVWELLDDGSSSDAPDFSLTNWTEVTMDIGLHEAIDGLVGNWSSLGDVKFTTDCLYLMFYNDKIGRDGVKPHRGLRYSIADGTWTVIPCSGVRGKFHKLHTWEPGLEIDT